MENLEVIEYDYAYSGSQGIVMDLEEQKEILQELRLSEEHCSEVKNLLVAFGKIELF